MFNRKVAVGAPGREVAAGPLKLTKTAREHNTYRYSRSNMTINPLAASSSSCSNSTSQLFFWFFELYVCHFQFAGPSRGPGPRWLNFRIRILYPTTTTIMAFKAGRTFWDRSVWKLPRESAGLACYFARSWLL